MPSTVAERLAQRILQDHHIQVSPPRLAIAAYVLATDDHPSADQVWERVKAELPGVSRATVYNTLNLLVEKSLLCEHVLAEGRRVYDANTERHHHFIDERTGRIENIPWGQLKVSGLEGLGGVKVSDYQVVVRGRRI
jgi:Fe2+ or Zn2+ uptake regulation protein